MANWRYIDDKNISDSGRFVYYIITSEAGDPACHIYDDSNEETISYERSSGIEMTKDEAFYVFKTTPSKSTKDSLRRAGTKDEKLPTDTLKVRSTGGTFQLDVPHIKNYSLNDSIHNILLFQVTAFPADASDSTSKEIVFDKKTGWPLMILNLHTKEVDTIKYTSDWHASKGGKHMMIIHSESDSSKSKLISRYDLTESDLTLIKETKGDVKQMACDRMGTKWAFVIDEDTTKAYHRPNQLFYLDETFDSLKLLVDWNLDVLQNGTRVSESYQPKFNYNGDRIIFGYRKPPLVKDTLTLPEEMIDVEVWSTDDPLIYTMQNQNIDDAKKKSLHACVDITDGNIYILTDEEKDQLVLSEKIRGPYAIIYHNESYLPAIVYEGHDYKDLYGVDITNGQRWLIEKKVHGNPQISPSGQLVYWHNPTLSQWQCHDLKTRKSYIWTDKSVGIFEDELNDRPMPSYSYGMAGFSADENEVFIYDRFDIWKFSTRKNKSGKKLTNGRKKQLKHRMVNMSPEKEYLEDKIQLVHMFSESSKKSGYGYYNLESNELTTSDLVEKYFTTRVKASKDRSKILFTQEDYRTFPDLMLANTSNTASAKKITALQAQSADFKWGHTELIKWKQDGNDRVGMMVYPEDFDPTKTYPLIVNFYERSSDELNEFVRPYLHRSTINYPYYSSKGYLIFNPDIEYTIGDPGKSALDIVESGVRHLIKKGFVDEHKIALQGHSWGGYQIAHIVTKSNLFTCAESGAPVVNMTSAYGGIRWGSGMSRMFQYEQTQSRLGATLWEDQDVYMRNSPLFNVDKVNIPILILHNDKDQAVPWYQGIEFFMALRRLGKKAWMLNYREEPHWPVKFENRKDFQTRMSQFFDHYMLDAPMPKWMADGIPAHLRGLDDGLEYAE